MKYIMFEDFSGEAVPVLFPSRIEFVEMREQIPYATVLSAGFVQLSGGRIACHGESKTLGVAARDIDGDLLTERLANPEL
ncbi:MAG: hypothetical protein AB7D57_14605 [Desulfovibrionaceae bacterium]